MIEVEKKCWLRDPETILNYLYKNANFCNETRKEDTYYIKKTIYSKGVTHKAPLFSSNNKIFRIRFSEGKSIVTFKEKTLRQGAEVNVEEEFAIDDLLTFKKFINYLGFDKLVEKVKDVKSFKYHDILLEHILLHDLGYFLEAEVMCESEEEIDQAISSINQVFSELDIQENDIEQKMYIELLLENK